MRMADPNPVYCSCCFQQQPKELHVDFQVSWDGPVINTDGLRLSIDDLYLCENCLTAGYNILQKAKADKVKPQNKNLLQRIGNAR